MITLVQLLKGRDRRAFSDGFERELIMTLTNVRIEIPAELSEISLEVAESLLGKVTYHLHRLFRLAKRLQDQSYNRFLQVEEIEKFKKLLTTQQSLCLELVGALKHKEEESICIQVETSAF